MNNDKRLKLTEIIWTESDCVIDTIYRELLEDDELDRCRQDNKKCCCHNSEKKVSRREVIKAFSDISERLVGDNILEASLLTVACAGMLKELFEED